MPEYVHGGDVYSYAEACGRMPLDLSANINPFGIPETVKQAMHQGPIQHDLKIRNPTNIHRELKLVPLR